MTVHGEGGSYKEARMQMYSIHDSQLQVKNGATDRGAHGQARTSTCAHADAGAVLQTSSGARWGQGDSDGLQAHLGCNK